MTKAEWIEKIVGGAKVECSKANIQKVVDEAFCQVKKAVKKDKRFIVPGFGTFSVRNRKSRKGRNPQTGAEITIKASKTVGFKPAKEFKGSL